MKKTYKISRIILAIMTLLIFNFMIMYEDASWRFIPFIFALIVFCLSFPSSVISRKLISIGNRLESNLLKILYYIIGLPILALLIFLGIYTIVLSISENASIPNEMGAALSQAFVYLFWITIGFICAVLPYIQTLIVLILNRFIKK